MLGFKRKNLCADLFMGSYIRRDFSETASETEKTLFLLFTFFLFYRFTGAHAAELWRGLGGCVQHCIPIPPHPCIILIF